jgi:hypothetical protein
VVNCRDCARFCHKTETCLDKKINPKTLENATATSQIYGLRAICVFNDFREGLIAIQLTPNSPSKARNSRSKRRR